MDLVVNGHEFSALWFDGSEEWHGDIREKMKKVIELDLERPDFYEMEVQMLLSEIWLVLLRHQGAFNQETESLNPKELARLKTILGLFMRIMIRKSPLQILQIPCISVRVSAVVFLRNI